MTSDQAFAQHPLLTAQEERMLARRIERGDLEAKDRLVRCNLRLVGTGARRYMGRGLSMEDLLQEGVVGLIRAAEKFDWRRGTRFSTYAVPWIRQAISQGLANTGRPIRLPAPQHLQAERLTRAERGLLERGAADPGVAELAAATGLEEAAVHRIRRGGAPPAALGAPAGGGGGARRGGGAAPAGWAISWPTGGSRWTSPWPRRGGGRCAAPSSGWGTAT